MELTLVRLNLLGVEETIEFSVLDFSTDSFCNILSKFFSFLSLSSNLVFKKVFTEEYQAELMRENFKAFDTARAEGWFIGTKSLRLLLWPL